MRKHRCKAALHAMTVTSAPTAAVAATALAHVHPRHAPLKNATVGLNAWFAPNAVVAVNHQNARLNRIQCKRRWVTSALTVTPLSVNVKKTAKKPSRLAWSAGHVHQAVRHVGVALLAVVLAVVAQAAVMLVAIVAAVAVKCTKNAC